MLEVNFNPFPLLTTPRLTLRRLTPDDVMPMFRLRSDPQAMKFVPRPLAVTPDDAMKHIALIDQKINENEGINWAITLNGSDDFIGIIGLYVIKKENFRAEIGYMLLPEHHNNGYVSEAIGRVLEYGFGDLKLHSVEAIIDPENTPSERVLQKNGFVKEAHLRENEFWNGRFLDTVIYSKLAP